MDMVVVATVGSRFEADMIAAKLGSLGVLWELRSHQLVESTHPIGTIDVLVPLEEAADAVAALAPDAEWQDDPESDSADSRIARNRRRSATVMAGVAALLLAIMLAQVVSNLVSAF